MDDPTSAMLERTLVALEARAAGLRVEISEIFGRYSQPVERQSRRISPKEAATATVNSISAVPQVACPCSKPKVWVFS